MKSVTRILLMSLVLGLFCATAGSGRSAQAAEPVTITYTYRVPVTVYQPPVVVYRPAEVVYSPAPAVYMPPSTTVVHHRGPLGVLPRQTVYYSSGGYYLPGLTVVPAPTVIIPR